MCTAVAAVISNSRWCQLKIHRSSPSQSPAVFVGPLYLRLTLFPYVVLESTTTDAQNSRSCLSIPFCLLLSSFCFWQPIERRRLALRPGDRSKNDSDRRGRNRISRPQHRCVARHNRPHSHAGARGHGQRLQPVGSADPGIRSTARLGKASRHCGSAEACSVNNKPTAWIRGGELLFHFR